MVHYKLMRSTPEILITTDSNETIFWKPHKRSNQSNHNEYTLLLFFILKVAKSAIIRKKAVQQTFNIACKRYSIPNAHWPIYYCHLSYQ